MSQIVNETEIQFLNAHGSSLGYPYPAQHISGTRVFLYESWDKPSQNPGLQEQKLLRLLDTQKNRVVVP